MTTPQAPSVTMNSEAFPTLDPKTTGVKFHEIEQHADARILDGLSAVGDTLEQMAWKCGWLTDELYRNLIANKIKVDYLFVCYFVSVTKLKGQRQMNTVKKWALTARFFPERTANYYHRDILPFSHFTYAASFDDAVNPDTGNKYWEDVLAHSWEFYLASPVSRHISVAELQDVFEKKKPAKRRSPPKTSDFTPGTNTAYSVKASDDESSIIDFSSQITLDESKALSILDSSARTFIESIRNVIPALQKSRPWLANGIAGIVVSLENYLHEGRDTGE